MKKILFTALVINILNLSCFAQTFDKAKLDNYFDTLESNDRFMGSVAVSQNGKIIYSRAIGCSDVENQIKANENSIYKIGSISKAFTAVLIFKAIEEKKISLNKTIDHYFPTIPNADKITISHLLYHRSGIHNYTSNEDYYTWNTTPKKEKEMIEIITRSGSDFEPGSKAVYSNSNYLLLTYILERVFQKPYSDLLKKYITNPLDLKHTYLAGKINSDNGECQSYLFTGDWELQPETNASIVLGAGAIVSTPKDLVTFSDALFSGKLVKKESLEQMKTLKDNFGAGLFQVPFYNKVGYGHTGGIDGFSSVFYHFSDGNVSYALTSNGTNFNNNDISIAVLSAVYGKPYDIPEFNTFDINPEDLDNYLGVYSSKDLPLKITITKNKGALQGQATGQPAFPLEATDTNTFAYDRAGVVIVFSPTGNTFILKQNGGQYLFTKE